MLKFLSKFREDKFISGSLKGSDMRFTKFKILMMLIFVGGIAVSSQVGNICIAHADVIKDFTIQVPADGFSEIYAIGSYLPIVEPPDHGRSTERRPTYKISIETNGDPINLLILDPKNYDAYIHGEPFMYSGERNMINGYYVFLAPYFGGPFHVILENLSDHPIKVHHQIIVEWNQYYV